jgi:hypothetical protein
VKVNFIIPSTVLGGGLRVAFTYANYLSDHGHDVVMYIPCLFAWDDINNGKINLKTSIANTFKRRLKINWFDCHFKIQFALKINDKYIRDADITIATAWYTAKNVYNLSLTKGEKVYFIQGYEINEENTNKKLVDASFRLPMHKIVIAKWLDDIVFNLSREHAEVIYNGTADEEFYQGQKNCNNPKSIIMLGNQAKHKGWDQGLEILKYIKEKYGCRIILYGAIPIDNLPESFEFYCQPSRTLLMKLYTEADICLFPSVREGWGLIVTEAMAHQCAIVGNNTGVIKELCEDGVNAMVAYDDYIDLRRKLELVIQDEVLLTRLQQAALETAVKYKGSTQSRMFERYLKGLIN